MGLFSGEFLRQIIALLIGYYVEIFQIDLPFFLQGAIENFFGDNTIFL